MNYLRGALQYYKDLPPINASTLTGAIDVIVVRRPGEDSDDELASTPFHVRFGKWQVLRPGDKKVRPSPLTGHTEPTPLGHCNREWQTDAIQHEDRIGRRSLLCL
jgi:phosphatidate phosphatase LPIN